MKAVLLCWAAGSLAWGQPAPGVPECRVKGQPGELCARLVDLSRAAAEDLGRPALGLVVAIAGGLRPGLKDAYEALSRLPATENSGLDGQINKIRRFLAAGLRGSGAFMGCSGRLLAQNPLPSRRTDAGCLAQARASIQEYRLARAGLSGVLNGLRRDGARLPAGYLAELERAARAVDAMPWEALPEAGRRQVAAFPSTAASLKIRFEGVGNPRASRAAAAQERLLKAIHKSLRRAERDFREAASPSERRDTRLASADYWSLLAAYDLREVAAAIAASAP